MRVALPGLGNIWTILLKDTSLISTLAVMDLLRAASEAAKNTRDPILFYTAAGARLSRHQHRLEHRPGGARTPLEPGLRLMDGLCSASSFNADLLHEYGWRLLDGLRITALVVGISCSLGFVLAYPVCLARMSRNPAAVLGGALPT